MKTILVLLLIASVQVAGCKTVSVQVIDDLGRPVSDANVSVWFWSVKNSFEDEKKYKSDAKGHVFAYGETMVGYAINAGKAGYYSSKSEPYITPDELVERTYVLPRVLNPIPLYGSPQSFYLKLPVQNEWLGYDLAVADWVSPHGKGKVADIRLKFNNKFEGWKLNEKKMASARQANRDKSEDEIRFFYGKWHGTLEVSFPNPKEGLIEEEKNYWHYSELRLPHRAPESGYQPGKRYEANTYQPRQPEKLVGYYLRTRVKLDADGDIISANYAKIYDDIRFDARGTVSFWYYFNPTPNDRNLEFDPARNLFPQSMNGANVANP